MNFCVLPADGPYIFAEMRKFMKFFQKMNIDMCFCYCYTEHNYFEEHTRMTRIGSRAKMCFRELLGGEKQQSGFARTRPGALFPNGVGESAGLRYRL